MCLKIRIFIYTRVRESYRAIGKASLDFFKICKLSFLNSANPYVHRLIVKKETYVCKKLYLRGK